METSMKLLLGRWAIGLIVAIGLGALVPSQFLKYLRAYLGLGRKKTTATPGVKVVPAWLTGVVERLFFTLLVAFNISATAVSMIGWITVKMVTNWNARKLNPAAEDQQEAINWAFSALLTGLVSMLFALLGGLIASGVISLPFL